MAPRASFDDLLDEADLPEDEMPSKLFRLPTACGPAVSRGPDSRLPSLSSLAGCHSRASASTPGPEPLTPSAQADGTTPTTSVPMSRLDASSASTMPAVESSAADVSVSTTPQRGRLPRAQNDFSFTPPALKRPEESEALLCSVSEPEWHCLKQRWIEERDRPPVSINMTVEEAVEFAVIGSEASKVGPSAESGLGYELQPSSSSLDVPIAGITPALSRSTRRISPKRARAVSTRDSSYISKFSPRALAKTGRAPEEPPELVDTRPHSLELVPYDSEVASTSLASVEPAKKRRRKSKASEELRGTDLVQVSAEVFNTGGGTRPKRTRIPPLEFWRGEHVIYERLPGCSTLSVKAVVLNRAGERFAQLALEDREAQLAIEDKHRLPALKDKPRPRRRVDGRRRKRRAEDDDSS